MTTEEKAKAYDEALKVLHKYDGAHIMFTQDLKEEMFPELKKSKDEEIKDTLIEYFKGRQKNGDWDELFCELSYNDILDWFEKQGEPADKGEISDGYHTFNELYYYRMLYNAAFFNLLPKNLVHKSKKHHDGEECFGGGWFIVMANLPTGQISNHYELKYWDLFTIPEKEFADKWDGHTPQEAAESLRMYLLEKQDEQNPIDKVELKFNVGDWVINTITNNVEQIIKVTNNEYICSGNLIVSFDGQHLLRKWTVEDAKDGDILITVTDKAPFIFKGFLDIFHPDCPVAYGGIVSENIFDISSGDSWWDDDDIKPATKEQRNFLFQKVKEAGYEWDAKNKKFIDLKYN